MDPIGQQLLEVAKGELGYKEKPDGYTKYGDWYAENVDDGAPFATAPWCDMFLAWAADKAGVTESVGQFAATIEHAKWFKSKDAWGDEPEPGTLVFFDWSGAKDVDSISHVGIVERVEGRKLHTIEANAEGMWLKRKVRDADKAAGYGHPGKVEVKAEAAAKAPPEKYAPEKYAPKHAGPPSTVADLASGPSASVTSVGSAGFPSLPGPVAGFGQEVGVASAVGVVVLCTVLAVGKAKVAALPARPEVRVRKRGRHHRRPVALPADITVTDLEASEAGTVLMPAITAAVAAEAEDREFWGRMAPLAEDEELAFWDSMHAVAGLRDEVASHR